MPIIKLENSVKEVAIVDKSDALSAKEGFAAAGNLDVNMQQFSFTHSRCLHGFISYENMVVVFIPSQ